MSRSVKTSHRGSGELPAFCASRRARANVGEATYTQDGSHFRILAVGEVWNLVRSGEWYESGYESMSEMKYGDGDDEGVRCTTASIVKRLATLGVRSEPVGGVAGSIYDIVARQPRRADDSWLNSQRYSVTELKSILAALRSLSSPWRKLPPELLAEVFHLCIPQSTTIVITSSQAPLLLGRVCSRWRDLCTTIPSLWTLVTLTENFLLREEAHIDATANFENQFHESHMGRWGDNVAQLMNSFVTRSLGLPISLSAHSGVFLQPDTRKLFYDHVARCKTLAIFFPQYNRAQVRNVPSRLFKLDSFRAPLLESLDLYAPKARILPYGNTKWSSAFMSVITTSARTLKRLNLNMLDPISLLWHQVDFSQSWENLTHITWLARISNLALINLFHSAPSLVYASFPNVLPEPFAATPDPSSPPSPHDGRRNTTPWNSLRTPVISRGLGTLVIGTGDMSRVFNAITLPTLRHLVHLSPSSSDKDAMVALFKRSGCPLETLYLYAASYDRDTDLLEVLENVEADHLDPEARSGGRRRKTRGCLRALLISGSEMNHELISDRVLERLTWSRPSKNSATRRDFDVLCPSLVYLSFYDSSTTTPGKLPAMLRSRALRQEQEKNPVSSSAPAGDSEADPPPPAVAKLMVYETWHQHSDMNNVTREDWEEMYALRDLGLLFRVFKTAESGSSMSKAEKLLLRRYVREEGLVVRDYLHDIGQFGPISLEEETRTS